jgi:hypothetical protein
MAIFNPAAVLVDQQPGPWGAPVPISYEQRDVLLYAVGIGSHDLRFVYEGHPHFAGMAARTGKDSDGTLGAMTIDEAIARQRINQRATAGKLFKMAKPTIAASGPAEPVPRRPLGGSWRAGSLIH